MNILKSMLVIVSLGLASGAIAAELKSTGGGNAAVADVGLNRLKAASGGKELTCKGAPGQKTCTSEFAWVCPSGWNACKLTPGVKTCCTEK
jgi:hypothetical protein